MAEKQSPPEYQFPSSFQEAKAQTTSGKKWVLALMFYAGAVTAALVTVSVLSSLYRPLLEPCVVQDSSMLETWADSEDNIKRYNLKHDRNSEDIELHLAAQREIIHYVGDGYGNGSMAVLDFKKNLAAVYDAEDKMCFLIGGLDRRIPNSEQLNDMLQKGELEDEDNELSYKVDTGREVMDLSLLPRELYGLCWGKTVYWAERMAPDKSDERQKRACRSVRRCRRRGNWNFCFYVTICN